jgi:phenylacetate-coenzyme A ligase PaaK-like adenylate-forming protein
MEDYEIEEVAKILTEWNPLGDDAKKIKDLNGYRTEAIDIIFSLKVYKNRTSAENIVMKVLNQAFNLFLTKNECIGPTQQILNVLYKS